MIYIHQKVRLKKLKNLLLKLLVLIIHFFPFKVLVVPL